MSNFKGNAHHRSVAASLATSSATSLATSLAVGLAAVLAIVLTAGVARADIWVLEPSVSLDQRFDDNYVLRTSGDASLSATRLVGELGLSRQSEAAAYRGLIRIDGLLTTNNEAGEDSLDSNQIVAFSANRRNVRTRYGIDLKFKQDTPSRDIAADLSSEDSVASDTGLTVTQSSNVARQEIVLSPNFSYDLSRRLVFETTASLTLVDHDVPDPQDAIYRQYLETRPLNPDGSLIDPLLPYNEVTLADVNDRFTPQGELDDFEEGKVELGLRYKLTPIVNLTTSISYSNYTAQVEPNALAEIPFEELIEDPKEREIRRKPRRDALSTTTTFNIGYERFLSPTLQLGITAGVYQNTTDKSDTLRADDGPDGGAPADPLEPLISDSDGWLASISLTRDAGATRYEGKFSVDVQPSSSGAQVETNELTGDMFHTINPRLNFTFRARAYEPDRLGANEQDEFSRRFLSLEPKLTWQYTRNWSVSAAYRYRRQKARIDPNSAESNAVLFSVKYVPPSEIRDAARANGL